MASRPIDKVHGPAPCRANLAQLWRVAGNPQKIEELAPRLRSVGEVVGIGTIGVRAPLGGNGVTARVFLHFRRAQAINLRRVEPEDLRAQRRGHFRVTEALSELRRDLES